MPVPVPPLRKRPRRPLVHTAWIAAPHFCVVFLRVREYDRVSVKGMDLRVRLFVH
jgi:hypothetical protein